MNIPQWLTTSASHLHRHNCKLALRHSPTVAQVASSCAIENQSRLVDLKLASAAERIRHINPTMAASDPQTHIYRSPKRKRGTTDSIQYSPVVSPSLTRIATDLKEYPFLRHNASGESLDHTGDGSPRSIVAVQLNGLDLRQETLSHAGHTSKRLAYMGNENGAGPADYQLSSEHAHSGPDEPVAILHTSEMIPSTESEMDVSTHSHTAFTFQPTSGQPAILERPRMHNRSPPLDGDPDDNPLTWHESEITGYNPTDPNDDGYGINGIGFRPTPAMAWARSQRRKQQLAEYKSREAKEARQRRSERRKNEEGVEMEECGMGKGKRKAGSVRFVE